MAEQGDTIKAYRKDCDRETTWTYSVGPITCWWVCLVCGFMRYVGPNL